MKRSYKQNCALALASDMLCERWTLLIFRELLIRACRFKDLNTALTGMGTNLLSNRLKELEQAALIEKQNPTDKRSHYQLTPLGQSVEPIVLQLIRWGNSHLSGEDEFSHQPHWDLLAMKALFNADVFQSVFNGNGIVRVQFKSDDLQAWVSATAHGLTFGFGLINDPKESDITVAMNIQQLTLAADKNTITQQKLLDFISCFSQA